ncbi:MAG: esterase-like activity of phytase family protein, partial [Myxococcales bacterium]|nr:esterase-like activity of phytase family protein [Myxococcales bacterium]
LELATDPGLSGLAVADDGALWAVAERTHAAYRITLDGDRVAAVAPHPIAGIPAGVDAEAIEALAGGRLLLGTEGHDAGVAALWLAAPDATGDGLSATVLLELDAARLGIAIDDNAGVEGVCGDDHVVAAAIETVEVAGGRRLAPVVVQRLDTPGARPAPVVHRIALTTTTGKLSAIDCRAADDGGLDVVAIERHFEVSRLIGFHLPPAATAAPIEPTLVRDLVDVNAGRNFEGLARLRDGRVALIVDNQWKTIDGPSQLVLLAAP